MGEVNKGGATPVTRRRFLHLVGLGMASSALLSACVPAAPAAPTPAQAGAAAKPTAAAKESWEVEWDRVLSAAEQEGSVVVVGPPGDLIRRSMTEGFATAYPNISLEWSGNAGGEQIARMEAERLANIYSLDILITGTSFVFSSLRPGGMLEPIPPALILPEVTNPANWIENRIEYSDNERQYNLVFATTTPPIIAYDPAQVTPEEVNTLESLLDPKWKGKLLLNAPLAGGGAANVNFRWFWHSLGPERATTFIRALKEQAGAATRDQRQQVEWVARGRYPVLVGPSVGILRQLEQEGLKVGEVSYLEDIGGRTTPSFGSFTYISQGPNPNAAKVYMNWLLSREGQTIWSTAMNDASRRIDVPKDHLPPEAVPQPGGKYWRSYAEENATVPPELAALIQELF